MPSTKPSLKSGPPSVFALWVGGSLLLWALYALVIGLTYERNFVGAVGGGFANVLPLALLAAGLRTLLRAEVMRRPPIIQAAWHVGLAIAFSTLWYATALVLLALLGGRPVSGFSPPAMAWQVFQGLVFYALIAAICYAVQGGREAAQVTMVAPAASAPRLTRYLIKQGEESVPVDVAEIISIVGAQDYSEVATARGRHLVRLNLGEFQARLDPDSFIRIHRSAIINLARLARTEPAGGGRMLAHMEGGEVLQVSRAGAQELRRFLV